MIPLPEPLWFVDIDVAEQAPPQTLGGAWVDCSRAVPNARSIMAMRAGTMAGWQYFEIDDAGGVLHADGVYVDPGFRKQGIAFKLWQRCLSRWRPSRIVVPAFYSEGGRRLMRRISRRYDCFDWDIDWALRVEAE